ncbi:unnamed protein product [Prorocentrum cordatum]|uniref:Subtilisin n=1 Tax=Prorocentrum cordatum TaxID=2364126 RepID=A0ABN9UL76_9DINO|nr:unnamed protein product [Polarella glacialis]
MGPSGGRLRVFFGHFGMVHAIDSMCNSRRRHLRSNYAAETLVAINMEDTYIRNLYHRTGVEAQISHHDRANESHSQRNIVDSGISTSMFNVHASGGRYDTCGRACKQRAPFESEE